MTKKLSTKNIMSINDLSSEEIMNILKLTRTIKQNNHPKYLQGKVLGMIFQKASTRTRVSFEVGMYQLGGTALYLSANELQLKRGETIADTARVLSRYVDGIIARVYAHQDVVDLGQYATVPVINALSDYEHPCQALADIFTIYERRKSLDNVKVVYVGDGNNVAHSLMLAVVKTGGEAVVATPKGYEPDKNVVKLAGDIAAKTKGKVSVTNDPVPAVRDADVIYTDVWASMGQEAEHDKRLIDFKDFQINSSLVRNAKKDVLVMHCLPAHRGEEITDEVIDGPNSVVWDQAENRMHTQKTLLMMLMR